MGFRNAKGFTTLVNPVRTERMSLNLSADRQVRERLSLTSHKLIPFIQPPG
jgi:hypothetical protein